jgi:hypothetical protein
MVDALPHCHRAACSGAAFKRSVRGLQETKAAGDPHLGMKHSRNLEGTGLKGIRAGLEQKWIWQNPQNGACRVPAGRSGRGNSLIVIKKLG